MLIGSRYAENLGVNIKRLRTTILLLTGIMTALSTSFCGPIAFIGLAVPHLARLLLRTDDFRQYSAIAWQYAYEIAQ
jgi:iron complex transport system permease protein